MKKSKYGQSMIEVVVGVGVAVLLGVSLITTTLITQRTARSARNNTQASKLVQGYTEKMRIIRDRQGFDTLTAKVNSANNAACSYINDADTNITLWFLVSCPDPRGYPLTLDKTTFYQKVKINGALPLSGDKVDFLIAVEWDEQGAAKKIESQAFLTRWD
ncbi:hypothetical protein HY382_02525 [Candidatus Curtissbacteria bacterium]|nr:hypothetical protein [Candidatus Curtissbacteria bacterium]